MAEHQRDSRKSFLLWTAFFIYAVLNLFLLLHHENWRDEAQAWLIARELSPMGIIQQMAYEGHPCLWYFILMPFAKSGFPYITMNYISWMVMLVATGLFLWKAPFNVWIKMIIIFSPIYVYFYPVISRSYCLIALFVVLIMTAYQKRAEKPFLYGLSIGLLVQTHIIMLGMAGAISIVWLVEVLKQFKQSHDRKSIWPHVLGLSMPLISFCLLLAQLMNVNKSAIFNNKINMYTAIAIILLTVVICFVWGYCNFKSNTRVNTHLAGIFFIGAFSILFQIFIYIFIYSLSMQRIISIAYIIIWCTWAAQLERKSRNPNLRIGWLLILTSLICFVQYKEIYKDVAYNYSDAYNTAEYIQEYVEEDEIVLGSKEPAIQAIIPFLSKRMIWSISSGQQITFNTWKDDDENTKTYDDLCDWAKHCFPNAGHMYVVYSTEYEKHSYEEMEGIAPYLTNEMLVYETTGKSVCEEYLIFKIPIK